MWFPIIYLTDMGESPTKNRQAGAEVTSEMVEAGVTELMGFDDNVDSGSQLVARIYRAMSQARCLDA